MRFGLVGLTTYGKESFEFSFMIWIGVLRLALEHGWSPKGTSDPIVCRDLLPDYDPDDWDPLCYDIGEGQFVESEDAALLAQAIEKAVISELCRVRASEDIVEAAGHGEQLEAGGFSADSYPLLHFVEFCRKTI